MSADVPGSASGQADFVIGAEGAKKGSREFVDAINRMVQSANTLASRLKVPNKEIEVTARNAGTAADGIMKLVSRTAGLVAGGLAVNKAIQTFIKYEQGLIAVGKTAGLAADQQARLGKEIVAMSLKIPATTEELLSIATAAGQLGVESVPDIIAFTDTVAKLGRTTNLVGEQAANALALILNITGEAYSTVGRLGSILVALGNNSRATESQIAEMTGEVAKGLAIYKLGSVNLMGIATALSEIGVEAELSSSVMAQSFSLMDEATRTSGKKAVEFAKLLGSSQAELRKAFEADPLELFNRMLVALKASGKDAVAILDSLGMGSIRFQRVIPALAQNVDKLNKMLTISREAAIGSGNALENEYQRGLVSVQSQIQLLKNQITEFFRQIGEGASTALKEVTQKLNEMVDGQDNLAKQLGSALGSALKITVELLGFVAQHLDAVKSLMIVIIGLKFADTIRGVAVTFGLLESSSKAASAAMIATPWGAIAVAIAAATAAAVYWIDTIASEEYPIRKEADAVRDTTVALQEYQRFKDEAAKAGPVDFSGGFATTLDAAKKQLAGINKAYDEQIASMARMKAEAEGLAATIKKFTDADQQYFIPPGARERLVELTTSINSAGNALEMLGKMLNFAQGNVAKLTADEEREKAAAEAAAKKKDEQAAATKEYTDSLASLRDALDPVGAATRKYEKDSKLLVTAFKKGDIGAREMRDGVTKLAEAVRDADPEVAKLKSQTENANTEFRRMSDELDPTMKATREMADDMLNLSLSTASAEEKLAVYVAILAKYRTALASIEQPMDAAVNDFKQMHDEMERGAKAVIDGLDSQIEWAKKYGEALNGGREALRNFEIEYALAQAKLQNKLIDEDAFRIKMRIELEQEDVNRAKEEISSINHQFTDSVSSGLTSAFSTALVEFAKGGEDAAKHFGESILNSMLEAAAQWAAEMLKYIIKLAAKAAMIRAAGGSGGGGGSPVSGDIMGQGMNVAGGAGAAQSAWSFMSGGSSLAMVAWAAIAVAAVLAISNAIRKHADAVKYGTSVIVESISDIDGAVGASVRGRKQQTGGAIADGIKGILLALQQASGALIDDLPRIEMKIRNDGKLFSVWIGDHFLGQFKKAEEAVKAAAIAAFRDADFVGGLEPILQSVIDGFEGSDPEKLMQALSTVRSIMDQVSGLSDIEIYIRDLDSAAAALMNQLIGLGVSMRQAEQIALQWKIMQLASVRDQITGHQQTVEEQRKVFEQQRAMFNAKLVLDKLAIKQDIDALAAKISILEAGGTLLSADVIAHSNYLQTKAELYGQEWSLDAANIHNMGVANGLSLEMLRQQMAALNEAYAALDAIKPIDASEFRPQGFGGGGGNSGPSAPTGPSEAEQRLTDFLKMLDDARFARLSYAAQRIEEINDAYNEQAAILAQIIEENQGNAEVLAQVSGAEAELTAIRLEGIRALHDEIVNGFGLPLQDVRNRLAEFQQGLEDYFAANQALVDSYHRGEIGMDQLMAALEEANGLWAELGDMANSTLMNMMLYFTDAMGDTEQSAALRAQLAQMEWDFKKAELRMTLEAFHLAGVINDELYDRYLAFLASLPDAPPPPPPPGQNNNSGGGEDPYEAERRRRENLLKTALDRLRAALEDYTQFLKGLQVDELSGATLAQREAAAREQYMQTLAQAQAGNLDAIDALPGMAQQWLQLASQLFDPSSSGYQGILQGIISDMTAIQGTIGDVLAQAPANTGDVVNELQTIQDILWLIANPGPGVNQPGANPHAGLVYYGPDWGWHPMGWSPGGTPPPGNANGTRNSNVSQLVHSPQLDDVASRLDRIEKRLEKQNDLTGDQTVTLSREMKKPTLSGARGWTGPVADSVRKG